MGYYIDLASISLDNYKVKLKNMHLLPSRTILGENLEERFGYFKKTGIKNIFELQKTLKNKNKFNELSKVQLFSSEYLSILLREINSIQPKPNKLKDFSGISEISILKLESIGIKDTLKLFDLVKTNSNRKDLAKKTEISGEEILELTKLTDLSRIKWVGHGFARILYETGFDTVEKVSNTQPEDLYNKIRTFNNEQKFYKGQIGLNDIKICIEAAKEVPVEIEYGN